jgi:TPR repeat protein
MCDRAANLVDSKTRAAEILRSIADGGDDEARVAFAYLLKVGIGLERDAELAADYLLVAAENGHAEAQLRLGVMYCIGEGVPQDFDQATDWLWEAEHGGLIEAAVWRGYIRVARRKDRLKRLVALNAADVIVRNEKQSLEDAVEELPDYSSESWVEKKNVDALRRHADAATAGKTDSQWKLGFMLATGKGTPQDIPAAREWYLRAAEGGCRTAEFMLGDLYENAEVDADETWLESSNQELAAMWYSAAVKQGHRPAETRLCVLAWRLGLAEENEGRYGEAVGWYEVSANLGYGLSLWKLGVAYALGKGVHRDVDKAKDLLAAASATGLADAQYELARLHLGGSFDALGNGVQRDADKAKDLLTAASVTGLPEAQYELARLHLNGGFEGADPTAGREWLVRAAKNGSAEATTLLRSLAGA